jgi:hypothetical protein
MRLLPFKVLAQFPGFSSPVLPRVDPGFNQVGTSFKMLKCDHFPLPFPIVLNVFSDYCLKVADSLFLYSK